MAKMTIREYARYRQITHGAIEKAITTGRITTDADGKIDPAVADAQWLQNTNHAKSHPASDKIAASEYRLAQTYKTKAEAAMAQMKLKILTRDFVPLKEVIVVLQTFTADLSAYLNTRGRRLAPQLVGLTDADRIARIIDEDARQFIKEHRNGIEKRILERAEDALDSQADE
jgi:hypothetical protein